MPTIISHDGNRMYAKLLKYLIAFGRDNYPYVATKSDINWYASDCGGVNLKDILPCIILENYSTYEENRFLGDLLGKDDLNRNKYGGISTVSIRFLVLGKNNLERDRGLGVVSRMMGRKNLKRLQQYGILDIKGAYGSPFPIDTDFLLTYSITAQKMNVFANYLAYDLKVVFTEDMYDDMYDDLSESNAYIQEIRIGETYENAVTDVSIGLSADDLYVIGKFLLPDIGEYL